MANTVGAERMNEIIKLLMVHSMTIKEISEEMCLSRRMVCKYLAKLESMYKIRHTRPETGARGGKLKVYSATFGVSLIQCDGPKEGSRWPRKLVKEKTGPKPKQEPKKSQNVANPCVRVVAARQIGVRPDPLLWLSFGRSA